MFLLSALLIVCAPFGVRLAQSVREPNYGTEMGDTSSWRDESVTALPLRIVPLADQVLFWKEYFEIEE